MTPTRTARPSHTSQLMLASSSRRAPGPASGSEARPLPEEESDDQETDHDDRFPRAILSDPPGQARAGVPPPEPPGDHERGAPPFDRAAEDEVSGGDPVDAHPEEVLDSVRG